MLAVLPCSQTADAGTGCNVIFFLPASSIKIAQCRWLWNKTSTAIRQHGKPRLLSAILLLLLNRDSVSGSPCHSPTVPCPMLSLCKVTDALLISNSRSACNEALLTQEGVTFCINVSRQQPFPSSPQLCTLRVPVFDDPAEDLYKYFERCSDAIEDTVQRGGKCLVYCKNGRSRSAAICTAYLMKHHRLSLEDAFEIVKAARPVADPNAGFWSQLQKYEEHLQMLQPLLPSPNRTSL